MRVVWRAKGYLSLPWCECACVCKGVRSGQASEEALPVPPGQRKLRSPLSGNCLDVLYQNETVGAIFGLGVFLNVSVFARASVLRL